MRIGIDACTWTNRRSYGRFTRELVTAMVRGYPQHEFLLVLDEDTAAEGLRGLFQALAHVPGPWHAALVGDYRPDSSGVATTSCRRSVASLTSSTHLTGFVSDEDLLLLYSTATLLILPSMSEGFGLR